MIDIERAIKLKQEGKPLREIMEELNVEGLTYKGFQKKLWRYEEAKQLGVREGVEEKIPEIQDKGDYYIVTSKLRSIKITKEKLGKIKLLYCDDHSLTINQICRKLNIIRKDFMLVKTAFNITHDDIPYIDEKVTNENIEQLTDDTLERRKEKYFLRLQEKEITNLKKELEQYRKQDYFYNKVIRTMNVPVKPLNFQIIKNVQSNKEGQINFADWHTGLKTYNYWNNYSLKIEKERLKEFTEKVIKYIKFNEISKLHVLNLGDLLHGVIHVSTRIVSEVDVIEQLRITWNLLSDVLETFAKEVEELKFYSTYGNHARITEKKTDALDRENLEILIPEYLKANLKNIKNIKFITNEYDDQILVAKPCGHLIFGVHGDRDKPDKLASNLTMMLEMKPYKIFTAHAHHKEILETHKVEVIMSKSLCGVEEYSKDIRCTSRAGQSFYVYNKEGLECTYDIDFN